MTRILIAEDDPMVVAFVSKGLRSSGFVTEVAEDGGMAIALCRAEDFDLVLLDMGLPHLDGLQVLRTLRGEGMTIPVIVLTGLSERDVVTCLEAGADDYMRKPFVFSELVARVRARLRDSTGTGAVLLSAGDLGLDVRTRRATLPDRTVDLTSREFALLETFLRHADHVLSREQLLSQVWGYDFDPGTNLVNVYVNALRKKLGAGRIETVRGAGYRLRTDPLDT